jgi:hypothetical protein
MGSNLLEVRTVSFTGQIGLKKTPKNQHFERKQELNSLVTSCDKARQGERIY